jgi:glycosyltransferase involved in cell wall biosynthesis
MRRRRRQGPASPASPLGAAVPVGKVVVLTSSYPRHEGDFAGRFVADAVERLRARGLHVEVVHPELPADGGGLVRLLRRRPWLVVTLFPRLLRQVRRAARDADLVHAHWLASACVARFSGRPFVITLHGTGSAGRFSDLALAARSPRLVRFLLRPARSVICVSESLAETMRSIGVERVCWIPNGVAIPALPVETPGEPFVLFAGRLTPEKGIADLVEATRGLALIVAGDGPLRHLVPGALGFLPHHELERLYDRATVIVLSSRQDGLPVCLLEAMAHGRAVVATAVGGIPELIENEVTGILVQPGDAAGLRAAIERLLGDSELRRRLGEAARARVQHLCAWEHVIASTLEAYEGDYVPETFQPDAAVAATLAAAEPRS